MPIAVRELKASLSRVLMRAQAGEVIEVTSHNRPIARIIGIPTRAEDGGLGGLIATGALSWSGRKPQLAPPLEMPEGVKPVSRMVFEDRG
jgi:prevent-host-death family protein